jgi:type VI secretion system secreted protein VgrG
MAQSTHFQFEVADQPNGTFKVIHWQGNEGISSSYRYTLSLSASGVVDDTKILGKDATLSIDWDGETRQIHGYVSEILHLGALVSDHAEEYQVVIEPPLAKLNLTRQNRVFLNLDVKGVLEQVLLSAGFAADSFKFDLKSTYPVREYIAQYNETDFNFFSRLLEHAGLFYNFVQQYKQALLVIHDDSAVLPQMAGSGSLAYKPVTGQVEDAEAVQVLQQTQYYLTKSVKRKDHNYRTPETTLISEATTSNKIPASGTEYVYGERAVTQEEGEQLARRRQEALDWQRGIFVAETNCRGITAGTTVSISGHPQDDNNGDFLVLSALHQGDQSQAFAFGGSKSVAATAKTYRNELSLIKKDIPYRTPVDASRIPQVNGVLTAKIETTGGDYAYLDDQGRYRLKPMFDVASTKAGEGSHAVRMMQPSAGSNYGVHFPLHAGTEVLIACTNGDPDRPVILGSVANPSTQSPVTSSNASQHTVRTFAGNELMMDDLADSEKINLHTKEQKNFLSLDANSDSHKVALRTEEGRSEFYAKKTMSFESGDSYALQSGNDQTITVENKHSLQTNKKDIAFNAATDIALSAKQNIKLSTEDKDISLTSGQDLIIEAGKTMSVRVMAGDSITTVDQGKLSMGSAKDITILGKGGGPIQISQGSGIIEISKGGNLTIIGSSVEISGSNVNINGGAVSLNEGGAAATVTAAAIASKAIAAAAAPVATTPQALVAPVASTTAGGAAHVGYKLKVPEKDVFEVGKYKNADGSTECVEFVRQTTGAPQTKDWKKGKKVSDAKPGEIPRGTAIATFDSNGKYPTDKLGKHAAIYLEHNQDQILVLDQWKKQGKVEQRPIQFKQPKGTKRSNDADTFYVIE